jgi:hypothetical protein
MELQFLVFQELFKGYSLAQSTRKSVQDKTAVAPKAAAPFAHDAPHRSIGYKLSPAHVLECGLKGGSLIALTAASGGAEDIACREMAGT